MKKFITAILSVLLFMFSAPLLWAGIFNLGNFFGISVSLLLLLVTVKLKDIKAFWKKHKSHRAFKISFYALSTILILCVSVFAALLSIIILGGFSSDEKDMTLVVLGCQVKGERPSLMLEERLEAAYGYLSENPNSVVIVSGGKGTDEEISEAECMFNYLTERGISPSRIYKEDKSSSTHENLKFSAEIMKENRISGKIGIVTNEFHEARANMIAKSMGLESVPISASTFFLLKPTYYVREVFALVYDSVLR